MRRPARVVSGVILALFGALLFSCGGGGDGGGIGAISYGPAACTVEGQNEFVARLMSDTYLWYDKLPQADNKTYASPEELLEAFRYKPPDKWSYIVPQSAADDYYSGKYIGVGFSYKYDKAGVLRVSYVHKGSPAASAGVGRGDEILKLNGKTVEEIAAGNLWGSINGEEAVGAAFTMTLEDSSGVVADLSMKKAVVTRNSAPYYAVYNTAQAKVGYLVFASFIEPAFTELTEPFRYFLSEGIQELVVDLRYNGGGLISVVNYLGGLIGGGRVDHKVSAAFTHNDRHSSWNYSSYFLKSDNSLDLKRVVVITGSATCSASEALINGLRPYIDVAVVGDTTCGKPFGMYPRSFCNKNISIITYSITNARGEGAYYDGLPAACPAEDDLGRQLGEEAEASLREALHYAAYGACSTASGKAAVRKGISRGIPLYGPQRERGI